MTQDEKSGITILIADDHSMVREGLRSMLNAPGLQVVWWAKPATAVRRFRKLRLATQMSY
jgi:DNA-binding NarL/FixJ family response regulator